MPSSRTAKAALRTAVTALVLMSLVAILTANRPFSVLFRLQYSREQIAEGAKRLNEARSVKAKAYFQTPSFRRSLQDRGQLGPSGTNLIVGIITVRRKDGATYLLQTAAAMDSVMRQHPPAGVFANSQLFVCNVDKEPHNHTEAAMLKEFFPFAERYGESSLNVSGLKITGSGSSYKDHAETEMYDQQRYDYMFCLHAALGLSRQYLLLIEDDVLAHPDLPRVLDHALAKLTRPRTASRGSTLLDRPANTFWDTRLPLVPAEAANFVFLKLYYPPKWQGFAFEPLRVLDLVSLAVVMAGITSATRSACGRSRPTSPPGLPFALSAVLALIACLLTGRQNINQLRRAHAQLYRLQASPDCCTPAMLYTQKALPHLLSWLSQSPAGSHVDLSLSNFSSHHRLSAYYLEPNLFQHIGMVTTLKYTRKDPEEFLSQL